MIFGSKKKGFTLVEMLIVIVIIGVLAAALIPRLTSVRGRANDVARKADIQQIATAIITYQMDKNGVLPSGMATGIITTGSVEAIKDALITAGMDGIPLDPTRTNEFNFNSETNISGDAYQVSPGQYGYLTIVKDGIKNAGFVLMAKTQTAGGSNRLVFNGTGLINSGTYTDSIVPCRTMTQSKTTFSFSPGGDCFYTGADQLRYIMAR